MEENMKLISWNINGYRAVLNKGFEDFFLKEKPDILCIQEAKVYCKRTSKY